MVIRIDSLERGPDRALSISGSLAGPDVELLRELVGRQGVPDRIDLSGLAFVDTEGIVVLLDVEARGAILVGAEPFVELLLRGSGSKPTRNGFNGT